MGFTLPEFLKLLPAALHGYAYTCHDSIIEIAVDGTPLVITLGEQQVRRIALLALPYLPIRFDYAGSEHSFQTFLKQFDLYYRKGGG